MKELENMTFEEIVKNYLEGFMKTYDPYCYETMKHDDVDKYISEVSDEIVAKTTFSPDAIKREILKKVDETELDKFKEGLKNNKFNAIRDILKLADNYANVTTVELYVYSEVSYRMDAFVEDGNASDNFDGFDNYDVETVFNRVMERNGDLDVNSDIISIIQEEIASYYNENYGTKTYQVTIRYEVTEDIEVEVPANEDVETYVKDKIDSRDIELDPGYNGSIDDYSISVDNYYES